MRDISVYILLWTAQNYTFITELSVTSIFFFQWSIGAKKIFCINRYRNHAFHHSNSSFFVTRDWEFLLHVECEQTLFYSEVRRVSQRKKKWCQDLRIPRCALTSLIFILTICVGFVVILNTFFFRFLTIFFLFSWTGCSNLSRQKYWLRYKHCCSENSLPGHQERMDLKLNQTFNPLPCNISMHILRIVFYTFPKVLTRRIC